MEPIEMVFQSYKILEPWVYLGFQVYKSFITTLFLALAIAAMVKGDGDALGIWAVLVIAGAA